MVRMASQHDITSRPVFLAVFFVIALFIHASYVTSHARAPHALHFSVPTSLSSATPNFPPLFIYRRTKKSGSSAMLDALIRALKPYHYVPLYLAGREIKAAVRVESVSPFPRRLLIAEHNSVTRSDDPLRHAVIADTVRDGYQQVTSFCRFQRNVETCDSELVNCLKSNVAIKQNRYRWAGRANEDADTYIDLPLSTAHPALSTTVLRRIFPNVTLDVYSWNRANSTCPELPMLRDVYSRLYGQLDRQVDMLRKRMLTLAGYPITVVAEEEGDISVEEMLDYAEAKEREKYDIMDHGAGQRGFSESHRSLISSIMLWSRAENDSLVLKQRWK